MFYPKYLKYITTKEGMLSIISRIVEEGVQSVLIIEGSKSRTLQIVISVN